MGPVQKTVLFQKMVSSLVASHTDAHNMRTKNKMCQKRKRCTTSGTHNGMTLDAWTCVGYLYFWNTDNKALGTLAGNRKCFYGPEQSKTPHHHTQTKLSTFNFRANKDNWSTTLMPLIHSLLCKLFNCTHTKSRMNIRTPSISES